MRQVVVNLQGVLQLAADTGLTAYDAAYLWLARTLAVELISLDDRLLAEAAQTS